MKPRETVYKIYTMQQEKLLLSAINEKNEKAWKTFYDYYYAALCSYVNRIIKQPEITEDLVQEIFLSLYESPKQFKTIQDLTRYLYRACYNNSLIYLRNSQSHSSIIESIGINSDTWEEDAYAQTIREEVIRQLYIYIKELSPEQQKVILSLIEGKNYDDISKELGVSINTIKTHKNRGIKVLRKKLNNCVWIYLI